MHYILNKSTAATTLLSKTCKNFFAGLYARISLLAGGSLYTRESSKPGKSGRHIGLLDKLVEDLGRVAKRGGVG